MNNGMQNQRKIRNRVVRVTLTELKKESREESHPVETSTEATMPDCKVCFQEFDTEEKIPKVLKCGHSFCAECIDLLRHRRPLCPNCRLSFEDEMEHTNFALLEIMEQRLVASTSKPDDTMANEVVGNICEAHENEMKEKNEELERLKEEISKHKQKSDENEVVIGNLCRKVEEAMPLYRMQEQQKNANVCTHFTHPYLFSQEPEERWQPSAGRYKGFTEAHPCFDLKVARSLEQWMEERNKQRKQTLLSGKGLLAAVGEDPSVVPSTQPKFPKRPFVWQPRVAERAGRSYLEIQHLIDNSNGLFSGIPEEGKKRNWKQDKNRHRFRVSYDLSDLSKNQISKIIGRNGENCKTLQKLVPNCYLNPRLDLLRGKGKGGEKYVMAEVTATDMETLDFAVTIWSPLITLAREESSNCVLSVKEMHADVQAVKENEGLEFETPVPLLYAKHYEG